MDIDEKQFFRYFKMPFRICLQYSRSKVATPPIHNTCTICTVPTYVRTRTHIHFPKPYNTYDTCRCTQKCNRYLVQLKCRTQFVHNTRSSFCQNHSSLAVYFDCCNMARIGTFNLHVYITWYKYL